MAGDDSRRVLTRIAGLAARHIEHRRDDRVVAAFDRAALRERVEAFDFASPIDPASAAAILFELLRQTGIRTDHFRYFGLFNPPALTSAIGGDIIAATVNPQLAIWGHAPAAAEIERHLVSLFTRRIWANHTALPLICFLPREAGRVHAIERDVVGSGRAWLSSVSLRGTYCLRACITGFDTMADDVDALVAELAEARSRYAS